MAEKDKKYGINKWVSDVAANSPMAQNIQKQANKATQSKGLSGDFRDVGNWFMGKPSTAAAKDTRTAAQKAADAGELRRFKNKAAADRQAVGSKQEQPQGDDFMDLLASLMGGSGGGGGGTRAAYSAQQIAEAQAGMGANRAKMEALYKRYAEDIAAREADIAANYGTAATNLGGIYDTAKTNVNSAYDAARAAQTAQLLALGMTEQTPVQSFGNQTGATTSLDNLRAAVLAQNEASRKAAITNQRLASEGATREGVQKLSAYDAEVARAIAEMQNATVSAGGGGGGGSSSGLNANQYASLALQKMKMDQDAQIAAANLAVKSAPQATPSMQAALDAAANFKGTPEQLKAFQAFYGKV